MAGTVRDGVRWSLVHCRHLLGVRLRLCPFLGRSERRLGLAAGAGGGEGWRRGRLPTLIVWGRSLLVRAWEASNSGVERVVAERVIVERSE